MQDQNSDPRGLEKPLPVSTHESSGSGQSIARARNREETVLVVEDDPGVRELARRALRRAGFQVLVADSDSQAMSVWSRHSHEIDLLLTDVMIPHCSSGLDLARRLRARKPGIPVVYMSGFGRDIGDEDKTFFRKSLFIQKPFDPEALVDTVLTSLEEAAERKRIPA